MHLSIHHTTIETERAEETTGSPLHSAATYNLS